MSLTVEEIVSGLFAFDVMPDGSVIASSNSDGALYRSYDDGLTWTLIWTHPLSNEIVAGQLVYVDSRGYIFCKFTHSSDSSVSEQLWRSIDGGQSFSVVLNREVNQPVIAEDSLGYLYVGTYGERAEVWRSMDGGGTWDMVRSSPSIRHMHGMLVDSVTDWVYAMDGEGTIKSSVYRSKDRGNTWTKIMTLDGSVNPGWVPMGLIIHQGRFYFGSDLPQPATPDFIYRFTDDGLDIDHNIVTEQVFTVQAFISYWMRVTPTDDLIIAMLGNKLAYSPTGDLGSWTYLQLDGGRVMFSHKWTPSGWMLVGSGFSPAPSIRLKSSAVTYSLTVETILRHQTGEEEPLEGVTFEVW